MPVGHVEAGLANRRPGAALSGRDEPRGDHAPRRPAFRPDARWQRAGWRRKGSPADRIFVTGQFRHRRGAVRARRLSGAVATHRVASGLNSTPSKKLIVVTAHRRESFGDGFEHICAALLRLAGRERRADRLPGASQSERAGAGAPPAGRQPNILLLDPLDYVPFVDLMRRASLILTDSGGIQEEGPSLGKPVLVMREKTERPEAVEAGRSNWWVPPRRRSCSESHPCCWIDEEERRRMSRVHNPYGDGQASRRIADAIAGLPERGWGVTRRNCCAGAAPAISAMQNSALARFGAAEPSRPNILLLMADQFRADCLGVAGTARSTRRTWIGWQAAGGPIHQRVFFHPHVHSGAGGAADGPRAVEPRDAALCGSRAREYPVEMPRALRDAGYYTAAIGKLHYHPQRTSTDIIRRCWTNRAASNSVDFRSDYRSWFWSQAPSLDPGCDRPGVERLRREPYVAARAAASYHVDRRDGGELGSTAISGRSLFPEGVVRAPAQPVRSAGTVLEAIPGCGFADGDGRAMGAKVREAERTARATRGTAISARPRCAVAPGILRLGHVSWTSRSGASWKRWTGAGSWRRR